MPVFEIVIIEKPTKAQADKGSLGKIVSGDTPLLRVATDIESAKLQAAVELGIDQKANVDRWGVLVRPFCE